jgi:hypothetical protein
LPDVSAREAKSRETSRALRLLGDLRWNAEAVEALSGNRWECRSVALRRRLLREPRTCRPSRHELRLREGREYGDSSLVRAARISRNKDLHLRQSLQPERRLFGQVPPTRRLTIPLSKRQTKAANVRFGSKETLPLSYAQSSAARMEAEQIGAAAHPRRGSPP